MWRSIRRRPFQGSTRTSLALVAGLLAPVVIGSAGRPAVPPPGAPYRILVTNDDGVRAPGILALARALQPVGEVTIVAPAENQSGKGHSISIADPIYADSVELPGGVRATALTATPASCVKVALGALMPAAPDLVVSGINRGYNLGMVTYVSGTLGAAREAALHGIPAIAASLAAEAHPDYEPAAAMVRRVVELVKAQGLDRGVFLNVNVPPGTLEALSAKGLAITRQSPLTGEERFEEQRSPTGRRYFWSVWRDPTGGTEGDDVWATAHGSVAVTPLHAGEFDRATYDRLKALK
jgi:5'-nucleotidase